jgi:serine/threonine protein kinase
MNAGFKQARREDAKLFGEMRQKASQRSLKFGINLSSLTPFPLTPTLSPGERAGVRGSKTFAIMPFSRLRASAVHAAESPMNPLNPDAKTQVATARASGEDSSAHPSSPATNRPPPEIPDYELIKCIGSGSYGEVWLARNVMGTFRAVKIVHRDAFKSERPFEREFDGIKKFEPVSQTHESQRKIFHVGRRDEYFYYVMELAGRHFQSRQSALRNQHWPRWPKRFLSGPRIKILAP